jgi:hypothetical protein
MTAPVAWLGQLVRCLGRTVRAAVGPRRPPASRRASRSPGTTPARLLRPDRSSRHRRQIRPGRCSPPSLAPKLRHERGRCDVVPCLISIVAGAGSMSLPRRVLLGRQFHALLSTRPSTLPLAMTRSSISRRLTMNPFPGVTAAVQRGGERAWPGSGTYPMAAA